MDISEIMSKLNFLGGDTGVVLQIFIVIFVSLLIDFFQKIFLGRLHRKLKETKNLWDDALIDALKKPLSVLIWVVGISFSAKIAEKETGAAIFAAIGPVRDVLIIASIAWFVIRLIKNIEENIFISVVKRGRTIDKTTADAITKLLRISVFITAVLVILQTLGFSISGVLAFGGIGGIAIGFAAKDLLANFFGGLMIYLDRPFEVGDWIKSPDREIEGTVEEIGWRLTRIRTFDKRPLYVPNSTFTSITVENPSRMTNRRIYETIGVRYDDAGKIANIVSEVRQMLQKHPDIDQEQTLMVNVNNFGPSSLDFFIYTLTKTTVWAEYHMIKEDVLMKIYDIIDAHGAEVAFPTTTVHVPEPIQMSK